MEWDLDASGMKFAVVVARFNSAITEQLLKGAEAAMKQASAELMDVFDVPGAFELPLAAKQIALTGRYDGIVALGAVIRGDTPHFDYVAGECARGLQQVALETTVPVAFGVLTTDTVQQAEERSSSDMKKNKGFDAAMTAIEMVHFGKIVSGA